MSLFRPPALAAVAPAAFTAGGRTYDLHQVIRAADCRKELAPFWRNWHPNALLAQSAERFEPDEAALQKRMAEFRHRHSLTAAEECEDWLEERGLTPGDMRQHFIRAFRAEHALRVNARAPAWPAKPSAQLLRRFCVDLLLSDEFELMAHRLAWRIAVRVETDQASGGGEAPVATPPAWNPAGSEARVLSADTAGETWLEELETAFTSCCRAALTSEARKRMHASMRMSLVRLELEVLELDTEAAAREAYLHTEQGGQSLAQVAAASGRPLCRRSAFVVDLPDAWRQPFLSAYPGTVLKPFKREKGYVLCRVREKPEPPLEDAEVGKRVDEALVHQHLTELEARHVQWRMAMEAAVEPCPPLDFTQGIQSLETAPATEDADAKPAAPKEPESEVFEGVSAKQGGRIRQFPFVWEIDEMDCGAASLAMVCRHFGRKVSMAHIRKLCQTSIDGTSLKGICQAAIELGLAARPLKISKRHLDLVPLPAIAHWEGNHWLVLFDVGKDRVKVADPAQGLKDIPRSEFLGKWSGYTALFDYTADFERAPVQRASLAWLWPFVAPMKVLLLQALGLSALVSGLQLLFPILTQQVVDHVIVDRDLGLMAMLLLVMGVAVVFLSLANLTQQYLLSYVTMRVDSSALDYLTRRLLALPMSYFYQRRTGDIQRRLDAARQIRQFLVQHGMGGLLAMVQVIGCVALMGIYSPLLLGVFMLVLPLYAGLMIFSRKVLRPLFAQIEESQARYSSHQIDAIRGIEAVKAAAAEMSFRDHMLREFLAVSKKILRSSFVTMSYESMLQAVSLISTALFLLAGARMVIHGAMTMGAFVAFSSLMAMASGAVLHMLGIWDELQLVSVLLNRIADLFEQTPEQGADRSRLVPVRSLAGHIELRQVSFRYGGPDSPEVLQNITLEIPAGRMLAIAGRSGSGKTTLVKLLAGLIEPSAGTILYDRMDLKTLNYRQLRQHVGLVLQENHLFDDTILNNIGFGDPEPDYDQALWAAKMANAHEFISRLPLGYDTRIGETGLGLSSGQKQRIAIARALYNDPPVLIFDEATSALDSESERAIHRNLAQMLSGRTCVVIAHRLSTIREADQIVVLESGQIAETGTHHELMARRGLYYYLCGQQLET